MIRDAFSGHCRGQRMVKGLEKLWYLFKDLFNKKVAALGFPAHEFGLHSLRAGGVTAAANAKVPDRLFKRHGRWKSENVKDGYVKDSLDSRLEVSRNLGLYLFQLSLLHLASQLLMTANPQWWHNPVSHLMVACVAWGMRVHVLWEHQLVHYTSSPCVFMK